MTRELIRNYLSFHGYSKTLQALNGGEYKTNCKINTNTNTSKENNHNVIITSTSTSTSIANTTCNNSKLPYCNENSNANTAIEFTTTVEGGYLGLGTVIG